MFYVLYYVQGKKSKKIFTKCDFRYRDNEESLCIKVFFEVYPLSSKLFSFTIETLFQLRTS